MHKVPETSKEAYKSIKPEDLIAIYKDILKALGALNKGTFEEIAAYLKIDKGRVWRRLSEMERMELIYRPGTKKLLKSGRNGFEWALRSTYIPKTEAAEKSLQGTTVSDYSRKINTISKQTKIQLDLL